MSSSPYDGPEYRRLLRAARRSLERTGGDLTGTVSVKAPTTLSGRRSSGSPGSTGPRASGR